MTPQELKNSILQQAIQGKLVEQRPEEGTAEELFQQIQKEKQRLIADGKIKKEKPLPEITEDEKPFDIPESWKWVRLGEIANITGGYAFKSTSFCDNGIRVIRISDFNENGFVNSKIVRHVFDDSLTPFIIEEKNILLCMTGGTVGKSYFVKNLTERMMTNQRVATIKILVSIEEYINFVILSPIVQKIIRASKNSTNDNISMETINSFPVPLPPLSEQKWIVAKIEEILPYIHRYEESWLKLEALNSRFPNDMKKSLLQYAIQGKLVEQRPEEGSAEELFQRIQEEKQRLIAESKIKKEKPLPEITEEEKPFEIPESWKWVRLKDIVYNRGQITPQSTFSYIDIGSIDNQRQSLNKNENIIEAKEAPSRARKIVGHGDILYATVRPYLHNVCIIDKDFTYTPIASTGFAVLTCHADIFNKYLFYYLLSPVFDSYANSNENAKGVAYPAINDDRLYRAVIALPPLAEQKRIVAKLEELLPLGENLKKSGQEKECRV